MLQINTQSTNKQSKNGDRLYDRNNGSALDMKRSAQLKEVSGNTVETIKILLIEDSHSDAHIIQIYLNKSKTGNFECSHISRLGDAVEHLKMNHYDIILLDLGLPDSFGIATFEALSRSSDCPIIILSGMDDEKVATQAVQSGAQDYLMKDGLNNHQLERAIKYAIERDSLFKQLEIEKIKAESASRAKSEFLAVMSHEFRTPMNGILSSLDLMKEEELSEELDELHAIMSECAENQLALINDLLDISKFEAGKFDIRFEDFRVQDLMDSVSLALASKIKAKQLKFEVKLCDELPDSVISDHQRIRQVLFNLLGNAIKFTDKGTITLSVCYTNDSQLTFKVKDSGIGIEQSKLDEIFEPFTQVDSSFNRRFQGTGLGLSICRRIVHLLGGEIRVSSEIDKGSEFEFTIFCQREAGVIENGEMQLQ